MQRGEGGSWRDPGPDVALLEGVGRARYGKRAAVRGGPQCRGGVSARKRNRGLGRRLRTEEGERSDARARVAAREGARGVLGSGAE